VKLRIASWNINSVRMRIGIVERLLREHDIDVLCLQECKVEDSLFPKAAFAAIGYPFAEVNGQRMHHGVATVSRVPIRPWSRHDWQDNGEARHVGVMLPGDVVLENVYVPAGGDVPDRTVNPKFGQKLDFLERMTRWSETLRHPSILVGDLNIAPLPDDVWSHTALLDVVSHTPVEVEAMDRLRRSHDWVDVGRSFVPPPERLYTWWSYRNKDWRASNRGRRLDHVWASPPVAKQALAMETLVDARDWEKPSDHVPLIATFEW
jgi:exodeoxyribonuclease-3